MKNGGEIVHFIFGFSSFEFWNLLFSTGTFIFSMLIYFIIRRSWLDRGGAIHKDL
jgi:hypothetical protein